MKIHTAASSAEKAEAEAAATAVPPSRLSGDGLVGVRMMPEAFIPLALREKRAAVGKRTATVARTVQ